jgi:conserved oligomeric Golgi complex subunit 4
MLFEISNTSSKKATIRLACITATYNLAEDESEDASRAELVRLRFSAAWKGLLLPICRIFTPTAFDALLAMSVAHLLETRTRLCHG